MIASYHRMSGAKRFTKTLGKLDPVILKGTAKGRRVFGSPSARSRRPQNHQETAQQSRLRRRLGVDVEEAKDTRRIGLAALDQAIPGRTQYLFARQMNSLYAVSLRTYD